MKNIYAFETEEAFKMHQQTISGFQKKLSAYQVFLEKHYALIDPPKAIIWTSGELATQVFSDVPIPAFTNKDTITITADLNFWRELFLEQLEDKDLPDIRHFYQNLSENHILQIAGHELTHHLDLFLDDFDSELEAGIWFEEGMVEYLSRRHLLTPEEMAEVTEIEATLVDKFKEQHGSHSLEEFGKNTYKNNISSIFYEYWRSYLAVKNLVESNQDDPLVVFESYHQWHNEGRKVPLTTWFGIE